MLLLLRKDKRHDFPPMVFRCVLFVCLLYENMYIFQLFIRIHEDTNQPLPGTAKVYALSHSQQSDVSIYRYFMGYSTSSFVFCCFSNEFTHDFYCFLDIYNSTVVLLLLFLVCVFAIGRERGIAQAFNRMIRFASIHTQNLHLFFTLISPKNTLFEQKFVFGPFSVPKFSLKIANCL